MAFTYDPTTDRGKVRLMIPDRDTAVVANQIFTDAEIDALLAIEGDSIRRAAALGLETVASSQAMVLKVIRTLDLTTDGAKVSDALLARAKQLRAQAEDDEAAEEGGAFDWAEMVVDGWTADERIRKEYQRTLGI